MEQIGQVQHEQNTEITLQSNIRQSHNLQASKLPKNIVIKQARNPKIDLYRLNLKRTPDKSASNVTYLRGNHIIPCNQNH